MPPQVSLVSKIKAQLKLAIARLRMVQQRDESTSKAARRSMAQLLGAGKIDSARIRVENIIRTDILTELHEILELYCELLLARASLLDAPVCDAGLEEAAKSICFAAPKTEIKELQAVRSLLGEKYGKEFILTAMENVNGAVSEKVVRKLRVAPPREKLVQAYLEEIARVYGVDWPPRSKVEATAPDGEPPECSDDDVTEGGDEDDDADNEIKESMEADEPVSVAAPPSKPASKLREDLFRATPPKNLGTPASPLTVTPPRMTTDNIHPRVTLNSMELKPREAAEAAASKKTRGGSDAKRPGRDSGIEDLERRLAALRGVGLDGE